MRHAISIVAALLLGGLSLLAPPSGPQAGGTRLRDISDDGTGLPPLGRPGTFAERHCLPLAEDTPRVTEEPPADVRAYVLHSAEELAEINRARAVALPRPRVPHDVLVRTLEGLERMF